MAHIVDKKNPEFDDVPETLEGEVLLERTYDEQGTQSGFVTAPLSVVGAMKGKTVEELAAIGWDKYKDIIDVI